MPELPEVERVARQLRVAMEGRRFERVQVRRRQLRTPLPASFARLLTGSVVRALRRRGKYLVADLSNGRTLVMHLGMSGWFHVHQQPPPALQKHDHIVFSMSNGATVVFNDPRRFGSMWLYDASAGETGPLARLGVEPLEEGFSAGALAGALRRRRGPLKASLMDQRVIAGLGNIYASEALHRAKLSPLQRSDTPVTAAGAPRKELHALVRAIRDTLNDALADRDDGDDRFRVYDREGKPCPRRGCRGTIRRTVQGGRSTFFCPVCQR
jgi:formamidopyrimidine-DNA glycosylase